MKNAQNVCCSYRVVFAAANVQCVFTQSLRSEGQSALRVSQRLTQSLILKNRDSGDSAPSNSMCRCLAAGAASSHGGTACSKNMRNVCCSYRVVFTAANVQCVFTPNLRSEGQRALRMPQSLMQRLILHNEDSGDSVPSNSMCRCLAAGAAATIGLVLAWSPVAI